MARVLRLCDALRITDCPQPSAPKAPTGAPIPQDVALLAGGEAAVDDTANRERSGPARIELLAATTGGAPNVTRLKVIQAEAQGVKEIDDMYIELHLPQAQRLLYGSLQPEVTAISLQLQHTAQIPLAMARLRQLMTTVLRGYPLAVYDFKH